MNVRCVPCKEDMELVDSEAMGDVYWCSKCGTDICINYDKNRIEVGQPFKNYDCRGKEYDGRRS